MNPQIVTLKTQLEGLLSSLSQMIGTVAHLAASDTVIPPAQAQFRLEAEPEKSRRQRNTDSLALVAGVLARGPRKAMAIAAELGITASSARNALYRLAKEGKVAKVGGAMWGWVGGKQLPTPKPAPVVDQITKPVQSPAITPANPVLPPSFKSGELRVDDVLDIAPKDREFTVSQLRRLLYKDGWGDRSGASISGHLYKLNKQGKIRRTTGHGWEVVTPAPAGNGEGK